jgi:hypothetical protein
MRINEVRTFGDLERYLREFTTFDGDPGSRAITGRGVLPRAGPLATFRIPSHSTVPPECSLGQLPVPAPHNLDFANGSTSA